MAKSFKVSACMRHELYGTKTSRLVVTYDVKTKHYQQKGFCVSSTRSESPVGHQYQKYNCFTRAGIC